jgi:hypothetical protein
VNTQPIDIEKTFKTAEKYGWLKVFLFIFLNIIVPIAAGYVGGKTNIVSNIINIYTTPTTTPTGKELPEKTEPGSVEGISNDFNEIEWDINKKRIEKETEKGEFTGYYCIKESDNFDSGEIWYKEKIITGTRITLRYTVKTNKNISQRDPILIFVYGEKRQFRMFFPDTDPNFIRFEDNVNNNEHKPKRLSRKIDIQKEAEILLTVGTNPPNDAVFSYELKYIPLQEKDNEDISQISSSNSFVSSFPWANPESEGAGQKVGIGSFNGSCIKPTYFKLEKT